MRIRRQLIAIRECTADAVAFWYPLAGPLPVRELTYEEDGSACVIAVHGSRRGGGEEEAEEGHQGR